MLFGGTGGPLWAFAGIEACANLRLRTGASRNFPTWRPWRSRRGPRGEVLMPTCSPNTNGDDALGLTTIAGEVMADARTGRNGRVPMGTKVWRRRLRINPNVVSEHESVAQ
jgi:hypothetical protein